jgi:hypothetical protein
MIDVPRKLNIRSLPWSRMLLFVRSVLCQPRGFGLDEPTNNFAEFDEVLRLGQRSSPSTDNTFLIDARAAPSYEDGHIPSSLLLDFPSSLLNDSANFTYLREPEELKKHISQQLGQDKLNQIVSGTVTVVNSELPPPLKPPFSIGKTQKLIVLSIALASLWRRFVRSD